METQQTQQMPDILVSPSLSISFPQKLSSRCPVFRGPLPGQRFSFWDIFNATISWKHLFFHWLAGLLLAFPFLFIGYYFPIPLSSKPPDHPFSSPSLSLPIHSRAPRAVNQEEDGVPMAAISEYGPWVQNSYVTDVRNISYIINKTDCWICMHIPTRSQGGLLMHAVPLNYIEWNTTKLEGVLQQDPVNGTIISVGSRIQELAVYCWEYRNNTGKHSIHVGFYPNCAQTFTLNFGNNTFQRNNSWLNGTLTEHLHNFTEYACTWQMTGCPVKGGCPTTSSKSGDDTRQALPICNLIRTMVQQITSDRNESTNTLGNIWMLCGRRAYQRIPPWWHGRCTLGYVIPSVIISTQAPGGRLRNRRNEDNISPLTPGGSSWAQIARGMIPPLGVAMNYRDLHALNNWTIAMFNSTIDTIKLINKELGEIREVVLQNRYALDIVLAAKGGICALVHAHCCMYIHDYQPNISATVHHMEQMIQDNPLHVNGNTWDIWSALWSWLPDGSWIRTFVTVIVCIIVVLICICCCIQCIPSLMTMMMNIFQTKQAINIVQQKNECTTKLDIPGCPMKSAPNFSSKK